MNFEYFWSIYPRRVSKRAAQKAWEREIKSGTDPEAIIAGLRRQLPYFAMRDEQFIPHASSWLNQGRFEDEVSAAPQRNLGRRTIADAAASFDSLFSDFNAPIGLPDFRHH